MKKMNLELTVGFFLLAGFAAFVYISVQFGEFSFFSQGNNYSITADFDEISGLKKGANVAMAGVNIGKVAQISLNKDDQAEIVMEISRDVKVTDDAIASIKTQGIIGDKYVKISQGGSDDYLKQGDFITETESAVDLEELISKYVFGNV